MSKEAMKLALEALERFEPYFKLEEAITALREALAQQALDKKAENAKELGLDYGPAQQGPVLQDIEQYRLQMAGICTAAVGYWKEDDGIHPDYDTLALRDVAKLYAKYDELYRAQPAQQEPVSVEHCVWARNGNSPCPHTTPQPAQQEQNNLLDCGMYLGTGKDRAIKHHVSYGPEPIDTLIAAWQALEETSGHVLDEGGVEGRMHMSVIRSAWRQMDSLVREMWDERGRK